MKAENLLLIVVILASVLVISGCTAVDPFNINKPTTKVGTGDILSIKEVRTIPYSPIIPGEDVTLEFVLENLDDEKSAQRVYVDLYDSAFMKCKNWDTVNKKCIPVNMKCYQYNPDGVCEILPLDQEQIFYELQAPTTAEIADITSSAQVSFRAFYSSSGGTTMDMIIADYDEVIRAQRTGQSIQATSSKSLASGPVEIEVELLNRDYALSGKSATIKFQIIDRGSYGGSVTKSQIEIGALMIDFSQLIGSNIGAASSLTVDDIEYRTPDTSGDDSRRANNDSSDSGGSIGDKINDLIDGLVTGLASSSGRTPDASRTTGTGTTGSSGSDVTLASNKMECNKELKLADGTVFSTHGCTNKEAIKLISGKSPAIILKMDNLPSVDVFRTFKIKAIVLYEYELRDDILVEVKPYGS